MTCIHLYNILEGILTALNVPSSACSSLPFSQYIPWTPTELFVVHSFAFSRVLCDWNQTPCGLSDWLLSLSPTHLKLVPF